MRVWSFSQIYMLPLIAIIGFILGGFWAYIPAIFICIVVPIADYLIKPDNDKPDVFANINSSSTFQYDLLLFIAPLVVICCFVLFMITITTNQPSIWVLFGWISSMSIVFSCLGLNVAHELGHRSTKHEKWLSRLLLIFCCYPQFAVEHSRGHHRNVGTKKDPSTAQYNMSIYHFWRRSIFGVTRDAWKLEKIRLQDKGAKFWSLENLMFKLTLLQLLFTLSVIYCFGIQATCFWFIAAFIAILQLTSASYIEHYGLSRAKTANGEFVPVQEVHSWNSNHVITRKYLFELSRHSNHHQKPGCKYYLLKYNSDCGQMPTGYPGMMLMALIPRLWFKVMNPRIDGLKLQYPNLLA